VCFLGLKGKELIGFFRKQVKLEEKIAESVNRSLETIANPVVKGVLRGISLDSLKHAEIYRAAIEMFSASPSLTEEDLDQLRAVVGKHVEDEERALEGIKSFLDKTEDERIKLLLESIASDERRHHELLIKVMDMVVGKETITEADWWEFVWKSVPFHGAPGG